MAGQWTGKEGEKEGVKWQHATSAEQHAASLAPVFDVPALLTSALLTYAAPSAGGGGGKDQ
jgi:hypothetical protein